ncbi:MAG: exosome complex protein Rrp4 [Desulfurococcales archaeon]|nr:exosome complex protein Rrp4 [Desulfurococcales archaeon]
MSEVKRRIVVPGERLPPNVVVREREHEYVYEEEGVKYATVIGLLDERGENPVFVPLQSIYIPKPGDVIIGLVQSIGIMNWYVDINSPYVAILTAQDYLGRPYNPQIDDLSRYLPVGSYVKVKVLAFDRTRNPLLTVRGEEGLGRITKGKIVEVDPAKIPRVIGRKGSMLQMLKEETGCSIFAAVNGRIHINCPNPEIEPILVLAIKMIEEQAHTSGLTDRVKKYISELKVIRGVK